MKRILVTAATALMLLGGCSDNATVAQTAEETVAFILEGLEDGQQYTHTEDRVTYSGTVSHRAGTSLYTLSEKDTGGPKGARQRTILESYTHLDACKFQIEIKFNDPDFEDMLTVVDMAKYSHSGAKDGQFIHYFSGECAARTGGACTNEFVDVGLRKDITRLEKAVAYFRQTYCKGAF